MAVEGNGSVSSKRVGDGDDGDDLAAQPRRVGVRLRQIPLRRAEGLGVAFVVDGGQERLEGGKGRGFQQAVKTHAVCE